MKRMGLTGRIWLSLGVFVIGYLCSVTVAQIQGVQAENRLERTSEALFPVAQKVQEAEAGFERMTRAFGDSVMLEDTAALDQGGTVGHRRRQAALRRREDAEAWRRAREEDWASSPASSMRWPRKARRPTRR